jgi:hypothetical protein
MDIKSRSGSVSAIEIEKGVTERVGSNDSQKNGSRQKKQSVRDRIEIFGKAGAVQRPDDEIRVMSGLLNELPSTRTHFIYEALAKLKAGHYASEKIVDEAADKLMRSGELNDLIAA